MQLRQVHTEIASLADPPVDTADAYLRLHLLSARLVQPRTINLDGIFAVLPNNAWTSLGPVAPEDIETVRLAALSAGVRLSVYGVDKFPRMTDYVLPSGVRIADADRVRLGAYLASGTTVMHEGFVNFNAGTLGTSMVEGRISQGVLVGDGSDIGGGSSIMGTLSGGGKQQISIGERCLLGANAGLGISLGDDCVVEAGLYLTAGTKLVLKDPAGDAHDQGGGAVRPVRPAVPAQLDDRRGRGRAALGIVGRAEPGAARRPVAPTLLPAATVVSSRLRQRSRIAPTVAAAVNGADRSAEPPDDLVDVGVGRGQRDPDVLLAGRPVELAEGHQDPVVGEPGGRLGAVLAAGDPQVQAGLGVVDRQSRVDERIQQRRSGDSNSGIAGPSRDRRRRVRRSPPPAPAPA